jgi:alkylhydroperoxidase/carboxymuconolactone decarboxylase family protein YurZ
VLTQALSWRLGFFLNVPIGLVAILAAPRLICETERHAGRLELAGALSSTLGVSAVVYGIVRSAAAGWLDPITLAALAAGLIMVSLFVRGQARSRQPIMPLRLFRSRERAGAYAARFLFNGALLSFFFFMTQYLQGVHEDSPLQAGLAFLPVTLAATAAATATVRLTRHLDNALLAVLGCATMLIGTAWISRVSPTTGYLAGIAVPMVIFGIGQGLGLSALTTAGMAGVDARDAGVAGGLVNVAHHTGGAFGLGVLITVFAAAGASTHGPRALLADRVSASISGAAILIALALLATRAPAHPPNPRAARRHPLAQPGRRLTPLDNPTRKRDDPATASSSSPARTTGTAPPRPVSWSTSPSNGSTTPAVPAPSATPSPTSNTTAPAPPNQTPRTQQETAMPHTNEPTGAEKMFGEFAPALVHLTDDVLFGEVWTRPELSPKERSLIPVASLVTSGSTEQLTHHLGRAKDNGATEQELIEAITTSRSTPAGQKPCPR